MEFEPVIDRHATWMVVNPIQGCPNRCKYCFLQETGGTAVKPVELYPPSKTLEMVFNSKFYTNSIPICFFTSTDIFATSSNRRYLTSLLHILSDLKIENPLVFITKCSIPYQIIRSFSDMIGSGMKVVVYLSYSGLEQALEPNINHAKILDNFVKLHDAGIPVIHYFRPLLPQNSEYEMIRENLEFVSKYAVASVVTGLKIKKNCQRLYTFWPAVLKTPEVYKYECVWPEHVKGRLNEIAQDLGYPLYDTNACALSLALGKIENYGFYNCDSCRNFNVCPEDQQTLCRQQYSYQCTEAEVVNALKKLNIEENVKAFFIDNCNRIVRIPGIQLTPSQIAFLCRELHMTIQASTRHEPSRWNTSLEQAKQIELSYDI